MASRSKPGKKSGSTHSADSGDRDRLIAGLKARNADLEKYKARVEQLEADLGKNDEMTRQLLEQKLYGMWVNVGNRVAYINEAGARILGAPDPGEVVGKALEDIIHPDYREIVQDRINAMIGSESAVPIVEEKYLRVDGRAVDVDVWAMRFTYKGASAILAVFKDITERKRAEEALKLTQFALDNFGDSAIWVTKDGRLAYVNQAACRSLGYSREELLSMHIWDIDPGYSPEKIWELWPVRMLDHNTKFESTHVASDGRVFPVEVTSCYTRYGDEEYLITFDRDITERKQAEKVLQESEERFRKVFDNAATGILIADVDRGYQAVNDRFCEITGYSREKLLTMGCEDIVHPDDQAMDIAEVQRLVRGEASSFMRDLRYVHASGRTIWARVNVSLMRNSDHEEPRIIAVIEDITERKQAEGALRESKERYRELVENANSIILRADRDGNITYFNEYAQRFFGYTGEEILGRNAIGTIIPATDSAGRNLAMMLDDLLQHPEAYRMNVHQNRRKNGELVWISWTNKAIYDDEGNVAGLFSIGNDITPLKMAEEELNKARVQAELYLDLMGHDINNMHQVALGYLELASNMPPGEEQARLLNKPVEVLQRSARLIQNVRKLQKHREGVFQTQKINVSRMLVDVQGEYGAIPNKRVMLNVNGHEGCIVRANELLHDVFANLVSNAVKHTGDKADIIVGLDIVKDNDRQYCRVIVEDDGPGIPDESKDRIFNRTLKGTNKARGMGLGLYLVKSLVESYNGRVYVEDRVNGDHTKGARFVVMLPAIE
ncbi:putative histidine kinase [Methanocella paludicola SANAE]|uniref:histidine kinase n=1 Tax=Methanocella paludicola (strain DSM 17711 / JCM 13418 / NBRC 101707 / SANAE) TaxID=304371 RepID=D1YY38_METPS|nr:PAS domain S-box protein [Methanocella paludicola]BAI61360.1 putative histidine kinase [Methanocella paludicola SANAE]